MATVHILPRVVPAREAPADSIILKKRKIEMNFDLLAQLAHTAHVMEALPDGGHNAQQQQAQQPAASQGQSVTLISDLAALSGDTRVAKSSVGRSLESGRGTEAHAKQSKHKQAEQRRRERINERLAALRELVPHDTRSNTATFLEGVISYIQSLQQSNIALEEQLAALQKAKGAEGPQQQQAVPARSGSALASLAAAHGTLDEVMQQASLVAQLAQPCLSGVGGAGAAAGAAASTPPPVDCNEALAAVPATAAATFTAARPSTPYLPHELLPSMLTAAAAAAAGTGGPAGDLNLAAILQHHQQHVQQERGSPSAATAPASSSAAAAIDDQAKPSSSAVAAAPAAASSPAPATPTAAEAVAALTVSTTAPPTSVQLPSAPPLQLQPAQLQSVLEKALLTALQQQAQVLASQLSKG